MNYETRHEPGCPAIADDESDYEHLADAGTCCCTNTLEGIEQRQERERAERESDEANADRIVVRGIRRVSTFPRLNPEQEREAKEWAADDRLWTTQDTVEQNLRTFARVVLKHAGIIIALVCLVGCDKAVRYDHGTPVVTRETLSCTKLDYCYTCMPGFSMKMECGFKMSPLCPGAQTADVTRVPTTAHYQSGAQRSYDVTVSVTLLESCR